MADLAKTSSLGAIFISDDLVLFQNIQICLPRLNFLFIIWTFLECVKYLDESSNLDNRAFYSDCFFSLISFSV